MRGNRRFILPLFLISVALVYTMGKSGRTDQESKISPRRSQNLIQQVMELIKSNYIEDPNPVTTMEGAYRGLAGALDILSSYLDKTEMAKYTDPDRASLPDIGLILFKRQGAFPLVFGILDDSPAQDADIKVGDVVTALDGQTTYSLSMLEANLRLKDRKAGSVSLKVVRGAEDRIIVLERRRPEANDVVLHSSQDSPDLLRINRFSTGMVASLKTGSLSRLEARRTPLILDLRNCAEGEYEEARDFLDLFLSQKDLGSFEKRGESEEIWKSGKSAPLSDLPLIVWINRGTLGPAEIVAALLQKEHDVKIVGTQTAGLTAKQKLISLDDGSGLVLTTAVYSLPTGDPLWLKGVKPDMRLEEGDESLQAYYEASKKLYSDM